MVLVTFPPVTLPSPQRAPSWPPHADLLSWTPCPSLSPELCTHPLHLRAGPGLLVFQGVADKEASPPLEGSHSLSLSGDAKGTNVPLPLSRFLGVFD